MDKLQHHKTAAKDKVSLKHKLGFGLGGANECLLANAIGSLSSYVFNIGLGVSPVLIGFAGAVPRLWEAITDPAIGSMSDNYRSRFGRRKPFIAIGAVLAAVIFAAIWFVPTGWSERAYFYWLLGGSILFFTAYALFNIPWNAMGYELTPDYHERTRVMVYRSIFSSIGGMALPWLYALTQLSCFKDTLEGAKYVGIGTAILMIILGLMPVFLGKENYSVQVERQEKIPLLTGMLESIKNLPFMAIVGSVTLMIIGLFTVASLGPYLTIYYVFKGNQKAASIIIGWGGTSYALISIAATPVIAFVSSKIGKRNALQAFLMLALVGCLSKWFCYNQNHPYMTIIPNLLIGPGFAAVWMLCHAMIADICDVDELKTGLRREGLYGAVYNWALKLGVTGATCLSGLVLVGAGFNQALGGGQSPHTLFSMRLFFVLIPAVANIAALILLNFYHITENKAFEIRTELEARRAMNELQFSQNEGSSSECFESTHNDL